MAFWIEDIKNELGITVLMVEHDMTLVSRSRDRVLAMNQGEVLATGTPARGAVASGGDRGLSRRREVSHERSRILVSSRNVETAYGPVRRIRGVSLEVHARARSSPCSAPTAPARPRS